MSFYKIITFLILSQSDDFALSLFGKLVGMVAMFFWFFDMNLMFVVAVNRYVAIKFPLRYNDVFLKKIIKFSHFSQIFSVKVTWIFLTVSLIISCGQTAPYLFPSECYIVYGPSA